MTFINDFFVIIMVYTKKTDYNNKSKYVSCSKLQKLNNDGLVVSSVLCNKSELSMKKYIMAKPYRVPIFLATILK